MTLAFRPDDRREKAMKLQPFKVPPQNIEAEKGVIGSILLDNEVFHDIAAFLKPEDFYRDTHQTIYRAIGGLFDQSKAADYITLADELTRLDQFKAVGGDETFTEIFASVPHAANALHYAQIVKQKSVTRQHIENASLTLAECYSEQFTAEEIQESAESRIFAIGDIRATGDAVLARDLSEDAMIRYERRKAKQLVGLSSGYPDLDDMTGGFRAGQLIVEAGRPAMGKTAWALNVADFIAIELKQPFLFVSLEMGREELMDRLICARARVDGYKFREGKLSDRELVEVDKARAKLEAAPLFIDDSPSRTVSQIAAVARRIKRQHGLAGMATDYVGLVDTENSKDSRQEQVAKISRGLKRIARDLAIPVIAIAQLNRQVEGREDHRPRMADLRESGQLEQDAHLVLLLYRPEYYDANDKPGTATVIVAKNRNGATGDVVLAFQRNFMRFDSLSDATEPTTSAKDGERFGAAPKIHNPNAAF